MQCIAYISTFVDCVAIGEACGFFLATPLAIIFESIVSTLSSIAVLIIASVVLASDTDLANEMSSDPKSAVKELMVNYTGLFVFIQFVNAFCVAALVEEMVKYFSYRMVVTPDLNPRGPSARVSTDASVGENDHGDARWKSQRSSGSGITVAVSRYL